MSDDERYYFPCPLRKNEARVPVTVCHKQKCIFLTSEAGKLKCDYGNPNLKLGKYPRVNRIDRDGVV